MENRHGLIIVNTGNGKGKTTAALGISLRAWGQGMRVMIIQFIKGGWRYGELGAIGKLGDDIMIRQMGEGFVGKNGSRDMSPEEHKLAAVEALATVREEMAKNAWDMLVLDEILYAIKFGLVNEGDVLELLNRKPAEMHVVLTGRDASPGIVEAADLVTEMREIKHPYKKGIQAQPGIEF